MALSAPKPRVRQTSTTTGTGTYSLDATVPDAYLGFVAEIGDTNTCHVLVTDSANNNWEWGTYTVGDAAPDTIARTTVKRSTNGNAAVSWGAGTRTLSVIWPPDVTEMLALLGVEAGAKDDQSASEIKTLLEDGLDSVHYVDGSIDTAHIADDAVTAAKLANAINTDVATGVTASTTANAALPKAGGAMTGAITTNSTFDGVDVATRDAILTSTTTTAGAALPKAGGTMTGNIAMSGSQTVDGRDLSADGTKLDAIESSAKDDQSASEIKTLLEDGIDSVHYVDGSIDTAHIADDQITLAKMAPGTDGVIISYDASGNPVHIGPGSDGEVLTSTGADSPPAFEAAGGGGGAWNLIDSVVASSSASLTITGLDSTYDVYAISLTDMHPTTNSVNGWLRVGDSGGIDSGESDYGSHTPGIDTAATTYLGALHTTEAQMIVATAVGSDADEGFGAMIYLHRPADGVGPPIFSWTNIVLNTPVRGGAGIGLRKAVITLDRIQFLFSSSTVSSGRMTVWGIAHA